MSGQARMSAAVAAVVLGGMTAVVPSLAPPVRAADAPASEPGLWQAHEMQFVYMGFTSTYSCDGLGDSLKVLLREAGADKDLKVQPNCAGGFGHPDKLAQASLKFRTLQPQPAGAAAAGAATVPGAWRHVEFSWHRPQSLQPNDCELVEQFADRLLPMFTTRNVVRKITCVPGQDSRLSFNLQFDVFAPVPASTGS